MGSLNRIAAWLGIISLCCSTAAIAQWNPEITADLGAMYGQIARNVCPHCSNSPSLSAWRKLLLGPSGSAPCRVCGKGVSVGRVRSTLVLLPLSLFIVSLGTGWLTNLLAAMEIFALLLPLCALLYVYWVPLTSSPVRDADGNPRFR